MPAAITEFSKDGINGITAYLFFLTFSGIIMNVLVLVVYIKDRTLRSPINVLFANLAVSDLMVGIFGTFTALVVTTNRTYMTSQIVCNMYGFTTFLGGCASIMSLVSIAVERYLVVVRPFNISNLNFKYAAGFIVFSWLLSLVFAGAPLVGWSRYTPEGPGFWCSVDWTQRDDVTTAYIILIFIFVFFLPIIFIIASYSLVIYEVRKVMKTQGPTSSTAKAQKPLIRQTILMFVAYMFAWTPYAVVCLIATFSNYQVTPKVAAVPSLFAKSSFIYNPIIYVGLNRQFRTSILKLIFRGRNPLERKRAIAPQVLTSYDVTKHATMGVTTQLDQSQVDTRGPANENTPGPSGITPMSVDQPPPSQTVDTNPTKVAPPENTNPQSSCVC